MLSSKKLISIDDKQQESPSTNKKGIPLMYGIKRRSIHRSSIRKSYKDSSNSPSQFSSSRKKSIFNNEYRSSIISGDIDPIK